MPPRGTGGDPELGSPVPSGVGRRPRGRGGKELPPYGLVGLKPGPRMFQVGMGSVIVRLWRGCQRRRVPPAGLPLGLRLGLDFRGELLDLGLEGVVFGGLGQAPWFGLESDAASAAGSAARRSASPCRPRCPRGTRIEAASCMRSCIAVESSVEQKRCRLALGSRRSQQDLALGGHRRTASRAMLRTSG